MASIPPRQHARTGPGLAQPREPSHAERVRTLFAAAPTATLSTQSLKHPGFPFGSLMPFALSPAGQPLFLISNMAMHTQNLRANAHASLFLARQAEDGDPLGAARATLVGLATPVAPEDIAPARELYLAAHPNSSYWIDFADFHLFRLDPIDLYYVGGFGVMGWVTAADYAAASPDPLLSSAPGILSHMNADHTDAMLLLAQQDPFTRASLSTPDAPAPVLTAAAMTSVDRLGFTLRLTTAAGPKATRLNFPSGECTTSTEVRHALVAMVSAARANSTT